MTVIDMTRTSLGRPLAALAALAVALPVLTGAAPAQEPESELTVLTQFAEFGEPLYPPDFEHFDYVNPDAPKGGSVTLAAFGSFERLDTITIGGAWPAGLGLTSDSLMTGSADELSSYYPLIATSVEVPDDLSYAIFNINPEARWHDGHPITAEDFVFALEHIKENGRPLLQQFWQDLESAEALDEHRVRFDFATTGTRKTLAMAASMSPMPKHYWEESGRDITRSTLQPSLYSGAYTIESVDPGRSITYRRVEDYWAADLPVNRGLNNFERVTYIYFRDDTVMFEAFKGGVYDFRAENVARRWVREYDFAAVASGDVIRDVVPDETPRGFVGFVPNMRRAPFDDIRVRQALTYLFDFEWTQANVFFGQYKRARSYFPNSDYGISDFPLPEGQELAFLEPYRDQLPPELFTEPFTLPVTDGSGRIREQLRQALRLFQEAGWEVRNGALTNVETGQPMRIEIIDDSESIARVVQPFIANLQRAGIDASFRVVDSAQYQRRIQDYSYDMIYIGANFFPPPGPEMMTYFHSSAADQVNTGNWAGIKNPVIDALLENVTAMNQAGDLEGLKAAMRAIDRVLLWNYYIIPTYYNDETWIAYWNKFGRPDKTPRYDVGLFSWWVEPELAARLNR